MSNDLCGNGLLFHYGCDLWRLADSIIFLQKSLFSGLQSTLGTNECSHLRAAWVKITEEPEVQDCWTSNK